MTAGVALTAGLLAGVLGGRAPVSLADKAYAATSGPGVVHWVTDTTNLRDGEPVAPQRSEGWARGQVQHIVLYARVDGRRRVIADLRSDGTRSRSWGYGSNDYEDGPAFREENTVPLGDPFGAFRRAHRAGRLTRLSARRYAVQPDRRISPASTIVYELDPRTGLPLRQVIDTRVPASKRFHRAAHRYHSVIRYTTYERLPDTRGNRQLLSLLPHPGAGPSGIDARAHFAVLRGDKPLTAAQRRFARLFARVGYRGRAKLRAQDARPARAGVVLIAGSGYLCAFRQGGGTCGTVDRAIERGMALGSSAFGGMMVVVPDGVGSVRGRLPRHAWQTFAVKDNLAILPSAGYHFRSKR